MTNTHFAVDELEVDVLESRLEMATPATSTCAVSTCVGTIVHTVEGAIQPPPSTCMPLN